MEFSQLYHRAFCSLLSGLACAAALLGNIQTARAGFQLSSDEAFVADAGESRESMAPNSADDLAAYLPAVSKVRRIDLSLSSTSGAGTSSSSSRHTPPQTSHDPASAEQTETNWLTAFSSNSASHGAGTSPPNGTTGGGAPAAILVVHQSSTDLQVTGWLKDASQPGWPHSMPRTLLRPPQT
jgi:hypothetical protein